MSQNDINKEFEEILQTRQYKRLAFWSLVVFLEGFSLGSLRPVRRRCPNNG